MQKQIGNNFSYDLGMYMSFIGPDKRGFTVHEFHRAG